MMPAICFVLLLLMPLTARAGGKAGVGSGLPYGTPLFGASGLELDLGNHLAALGGIGVGNYDARWRSPQGVPLVSPDAQPRARLCRRPMCEETVNA